MKYPDLNEKPDFQAQGLFSHDLKTLHVTWQTPPHSKVYEELGKFVVAIMSFVEEVEFADYEGFVVKVRPTAVDIINKVKPNLKYINVWFEGEGIA